MTRFYIPRKPLKVRPYLSFAACRGPFSTVADRMTYRRVDEQWVGCAASQWLLEQQRRTG